MAMPFFGSSLEGDSDSEGERREAGIAVVVILSGAWYLTWGSFRRLDKVLDEAFTEDQDCQSRYR